MFLGNSLCYDKTFNFEENLGKEVYVVGHDKDGIQQQYDVYDNYEEAKSSYETLSKSNKDKSWSYTLEKCIVKSDELEAIEIYY